MLFVLLFLYYYCCIQICTQAWKHFIVDRIAQTIREKAKRYLQNKLSPLEDTSSIPGLRRGLTSALTNWAVKGNTKDQKVHAATATVGIDSEIYKMLAQIRINSLSLQRAEVKVQHWGTICNDKLLPLCVAQSEDLTGSKKVAIPNSFGPPLLFGAIALNMGSKHW